MVRQVVCIAFAAATFATVAPSSAFAWGCYARGHHGVYGYSYNYGNRGGAIERALEECSARGSGCRIINCNPYK